MSQPSIRQEGRLVRVSEQVHGRLLQLAAERREDLGRAVSMSEVIEGLLADQWGEKPC